MSNEKTTEIIEREGATLSEKTATAADIQGFEEAKSEDIIIPRVKVVNALSPERVDGIAQEGDVIDSLSQVSVKGKKFIPIKVYYSNIHWNPDRDDENNRIFCRSFDGTAGEDSEGNCYSCKACGKNRFDNTKTGKEAQPQCTSYINFLGFFAGEYMPVVLSFSKTNYNEGKKMLSVAMSLRKSIWSYSYIIDSKQVTKGKNKWYNITVTLSEPTSDSDKLIAAEIYKQYHATQIKTDYSDESVNTTATDAATEAEI